MKVQKFISKSKFLVADQNYGLAFCKIIDSAETLGYIDQQASIIYVKDNQTIEESFKTVIHELVHAMDYEYKIKLKHPQVYKLERALAELLVKNGLIKL